MEAKVPAQQVREACHAEAEKRKDKLQKLKDIDPGGQLETYDREVVWSDWHMECCSICGNAEEAQEQALKELQSPSQSFKLDTLALEDPSGLLTDDAAKQNEIEIKDKAFENAEEAQHGKDKPQTNELHAALTGLSTLYQIGMPNCKDSTSAKCRRDFALRDNCREMGSKPMDTAFSHLPLGSDHTPRDSERLTLERSTELLTFFPTLFAPPSPIEHHTQMLPLILAEFSGLAGCSLSSTASNESNVSASSEPASLSQSQRPPAAEVLRNIRSLRASDPLGTEPECGSLADGQAGLLWQTRFDGVADSDKAFDDKHESTPSSVSVSDPGVRSTRSSTLRSATSATASPPSAIAPSEEQFSAARGISGVIMGSSRTAASASLATSRQRGWRRGSNSSTSTPTPPPPPRSCRKLPGHNKTWGFTAGPGSPWIEPPIVNDLMFTRPSLYETFMKDVKDAITQLLEGDTDHNPHVPTVIQKQADMYALRVKSAMRQWPISDVRGAVRCEDVQKMRLGVANRAEMRQAKAGESEEDLEEQREAGMGVV